MECTLCQSPLAEGAKVCGACGAPALFDAAPTIAGGRGPDTSGGPPRGEVLAERWEIQERIANDSLTSRYRALDQETEAQVVLTIIAPDLVPTASDRDALRDRLAAAVGVGGKFLPGLLDADREAQFVFAVEPLVLGTSLRSVLDARRARHETMQVTELLPVVAQLAAALAGVAPPHHHGDVRAERVVIAKEGLRLVGGFIVPALPAAAIARALANDEGWRAVVAPEVLRGAASDAADRFGVAAIAFEALTGRLPSFVGPRLPRELEVVDDALRALLSRDPTTRPGSLDALIEALAECAHLPIPDLDPGTFRRVRRPAPSRPAPPGVGPPQHEPPSAASEVETSPDSATPPSDPDDLGAETSPLTKIDADATSRMPALNADGELDVPPLASSGSYPDIPDLATDPMSTMPTKQESSRAAQILVPDSLAPAYRVDEGPTLSESALRTRRVLAQPATAPSTPAPEAPVAVVASAGKPASAKQAPSGRARPVAGAAKGGTQEIEMDELFDGTPARAKRQDDSLDPRLVRAALGVALDDVAPASPAAAKKKPRDDDSLDPRLVRAALGIALDGADEDEEDEPATTMRPAAAASPRKGVTGDTQQLTADDLADMSAAAGRRSARITSDNGPPSARRKREEEPPRVVRIPRYDVAKPAAAPQPASRVPPRAAPTPSLAGTVPLPPSALRAANDPITQDAPPAPVAVAPLASVPTAVSAQPARPTPLRGPVASPEDLMTPAPHASRDRAVIWVSLVLALVIVSVGAGIAWWRHTQAVNERERRLQERFQELRNQP